MNLVRYLLIGMLTLSWFRAALSQEGDQLSAVHAPESTGVWSQNSFEYIRAVAANSPFRIAASPVGLIAIEFSTNGQEPVCTGMVISPKLVLTARHCLERFNKSTNAVEQIVPRSISLELDFLSIGTGTVFDLETSPVDVGKGDLDFMVLRSKQEIPLVGRRIPPVGKDPTSREDLYVIHQPGGEVLKLSRYDCRAADEPTDGDFFRHICDTQPGSSGAPVLDFNFRLVGVHTRNGKSELPGSFNIGLLLSKILSASPTVAEALRKYSTLSIAPFVSQPVVDVQASYLLPDGSSFARTSSGWTMSANTSATQQQVRLVPQRSADGIFILWDPAGDWFYLVPKDGGNVMRKHTGEAQWTDIGIAQKR